MKHIREMQDFEGVIKAIKDGEIEKRQAVLDEVEAFEKGTGIMIDTYYKSLDEDHMKDREEDIVEELHEFVSDIEGRMTQKLENVNEKLDECEDNFYDSIQQEVDDLRDTLIEIAFKLAPEITVTVEEIRDSFKMDIEKGKEKNKEYFEALKARTFKKIVETKEIAIQKEAQWRKIKHDIVMAGFKEEINSKRIRHP